MPNPLIQKYLDDPTVDPMKRKNLFEALEAGSVDENDIANKISEKMGPNYGGGSQQQSSNVGSPSMPQAPQPPAQPKQGANFWDAAMGGALKSVMPPMKPPAGPNYKQMSGPELQNEVDQSKNSGQFNSFTGNKASGEQFRRELQGRDQGRVEFLTESTLKPIGKFLAAGPVSKQRDAAGMKAYATTQGTEEQKRAAMQAEQVKPVNLPYLGNVNTYAGKRDQFNQPVPGLDVGKSFLNAGGNIADAASGVMNILNPAAGSVKGAFARGAAQSAAKAVQEDDATPEGVGLNAAFGGGLNALFVGGSKALTKFRDWRADTMGVDDMAKKTLLDPKNSEALKQGIDYAKRTAGDVNAPTLMKQAGRNLNNDYKNVFKKYKDSIGAKMQPYVEQAAPQNVNGAVTNLKKNMEKLGVVISKGGQLDFTTSKIGSDANSKKVLQDLWSQFSNKGKILPSMDTKVLQNIIQDKRSNVLQLGKLNPNAVGKIGKNPIKQFIGELDGIFKKSLPSKALPLWKEYSELADADNFLAKYLDNEKPSEVILEQIFGKQKEKLLPSLEKVGKVTGKNYVNAAKIAKTAPSVLKEGKSSGMKEDFLRMFFKPKEGAAKGLIKEAQGKGVTGLPKKLLGKYQALPVAVTDYLNKFLKQDNNQPYYGS